MEMRKKYLEKWKNEQTENVVIFRFNKEENTVLVKAVIEMLNEKLTLLEFGHTGWVLSEKDVCRIKKDGIFAVLEDLRSTEGRIYALELEDVFSETAGMYDAVVAEIRDKFELYSILESGECLGEYLMAKII